MKLLNWQCCKDLDEIYTAIAEQDELWYGLKSTKQIIDIAYDTSQNCYVVSWVYERK